MGRELDPNFSKLSIFPGVFPPPPPLPHPRRKTLIGASGWRKLWSLASYEKYNGNSDQTERMPTLIWVFAGRLWSFHLFLFCWGPYKNVYATFMHGTHLTYNAPSETWASWSFLHRECAIEKKNLIVLWSDDDDDDCCCDGGGATRHEGYHHYLK